MDTNRLARGLGIAIRTGIAPVLLGMRWRQGFDDHGGRPIPSLEVGWRVRSKRALDEFFLATELASATTVSAKERARLGRELTEAVDLFEAKGWIEDPASYHLEPESARLVQRESAGGLLARFEHIRFESGYEPHAEEPGRDR